NDVQLRGACDVCRDLDRDGVIELTTRGTRSLDVESGVEFAVVQDSSNVAGRRFDSAREQADDHGSLDGAGLHERLGEYKRLTRPSGQCLRWETEWLCPARRTRIRASRQRAWR
ncbi:unnamed protein product, partial [Mycena citricolor]